MPVQVWPGRWLGKARPWSGWAWACWTPLAPAGQRSRPPALSTPSGTHPQIRHTCCVVAVTPGRRVEKQHPGIFVDHQARLVLILLVFWLPLSFNTHFYIISLMISFSLHHSWLLNFLHLRISKSNGRWKLRGIEKDTVADDMPFLKVSALADR
jgi:hypothetical protein